MRKIELDSFKRQKAYLSACFPFLLEDLLALNKRTIPFNGFGEKEGATLLSKSWIIKTILFLYCVLIDDFIVLKYNEQCVIIFFIETKKMKSTAELKRNFRVIF